MSRLLSHVLKRLLPKLNGRTNIIYQHISLIESAFSTVLKFKDSIDAFGKRALFLAIFRYKLYETNAVIEHLRELSDYEILAAFKSDSQVKVS